MFNIMIKRYVDSEQVKIYSNPIKENTEPRKYDRVTGEIYGVGTIQFNPFTESLDCLKTFDSEDSAVRSFNRTKNKVYDLLRSNVWDLFVTFTYDSEKLDRYDYDLCSSKLQNWLIRMRRINIDLKYVIVPEQHKDGAWHFHGLFSNFRDDLLVDSGKVHKNGQKIWNIDSYGWGFTTAIKSDGSNRLSNYVAKYITKDMCAVTKGKKRYWASRNLNKPVVIKLMCQEKEEEIISKMQNINYMKSTENFLGKVTYIDLPIYTTNTDFSNRYRQKPPNTL